MNYLKMIQTRDNLKVHSKNILEILERKSGNFGIRNILSTNKFRINIFHCLWKNQNLFLVHFIDNTEKTKTTKEFVYLPEHTKLSEGFVFLGGLGEPKFDNLMIISRIYVNEPASLNLEEKYEKIRIENSFTLASKNFRLRIV